MNKCILVLGGTCGPSSGTLRDMGFLNGHSRFLGDCPIFSRGQLQRFHKLDQGGLRVFGELKIWGRGGDELGN